MLAIRPNMAVQNETGRQAHMHTQFDWRLCRRPWRHPPKSFLANFAHSLALLLSDILTVTSRHICTAEWDNVSLSSAVCLSVCSSPWSTQLNFLTFWLSLFLRSLSTGSLFSFSFLVPSKPFLPPPPPSPPPDDRISQSVSQSVREWDWGSTREYCCCCCYILEGTNLAWCANSVTQAA